jgi:hypothetical protein
MLKLIALLGKMKYTLHSCYNYAFSEYFSALIHFHDAN